MKKKFAFLSRIFFAMSRQDRTLTIVLSIIFLVSFSYFIISHIRFPLRQEKGVFSEGVMGHVKAINPLFVEFNAVDRDLSTLIFSGLIRFDPAQKNFLPDLAEKWERTNNALTYTFTLRQNIKWHDGVPVTADDILFTFDEVVQHPEFTNKLLQTTFEGVSVIKKDERTITFILSKPNSYFISNLTVGILPKHLLENTPVKNLGNASFNEFPIGTGPYKVKEVDLDASGDQVDLEVFADFYGERPRIPAIRFLTFPDEKSLIAERGALHALAKLPQASVFIESLSNDSRFNLNPYILNQFTGIYFNTDHPILKDQKVRQALLKALNKDTLVFAGEQRVDALDFLDHTKDPAFMQKPDEAASLLDSVNIKKGVDGMRVTDQGRKFSFTLVTLDSMPNTLIDKIKEQWAALGIEVIVEKMRSDAFTERVNKRNYGALLLRQNLGYNRDVYPLFHSSQAGEGGLNFSNFKSFRTDGLTEAIRKERDPEDKEKLLRELSKVIIDETPVILLSTPVYYYALDKAATGMEVKSFDFHSDRLRVLPYLMFSNL